MARIFCQQLIFRARKWVTQNNVARRFCPRSSIVDAAEQCRCSGGNKRLVANELTAERFEWFTTNCLKWQVYHQISPIVSYSSGTDVNAPCSCSVRVRVCSVLVLNISTTTIHTCLHEYTLYAPISLFYKNIPPPHLSFYYKRFFSNWFISRQRNLLVCSSHHNRRAPIVRHTHFILHSHVYEPAKRKVDGSPWNHPITSKMFCVKISEYLI